MDEIDRDRAAVYAAEDQLVAALDRGGTDATVDFFGSHLTLPAERKFADLDSVRRYLENVVKLPAVGARWPNASAPTVRNRKGPRKAHYADGVIALPIDERWAARESVVLHELAHHFTIHDVASAHDAVFVTAYVFLLESVMGFEVGLLFRAALDGAGVRVVEPR